MVLAGAGSGKTYTIVEKIKFLLENDVKEEEILCISFTKKSAHSLQKSLSCQGLYIDVKTFHSLGYEIVSSCMNVNLVNSEVLGNIIERYLLKEEYLAFISKVAFKNFGKYDVDIRKMQNNMLFNSSYKNKLVSIIERFINLYKGSNMSFDSFLIFHKMNRTCNFFDERKRHACFLKMVKKIIKGYNSYLRKNKLIDYHDMINIAVKIIRRKCNYNYKYIIIDEYQDISLNKIDLIKEIQKKTCARMMAVGDDFQSIYGFTGSNVDVIKNFRSYFPKAKIKKLRYTYRNSEELLKITHKFICKNPNQVKKRLRSNISNKKPIMIFYYDNLSDIWDDIVKRVFGKEVFILGRNNKDKKIIPYLSNNMKYLTIHKSKGLEVDTTIIINLEDSINSLPSKIQDSEYLMYVKPKMDKYKYSEERRLFYVALTRCKNNNILLVKRDNPSVFIKELIDDNKNIKPENE